MMRAVAEEHRFFGLNQREIVCLVFAISVHSLLFLWKGGMLDFGSTDQNLGEALVQVGYLSEIPEWDAPPAGGVAPAKGLFAKVKSIFTKSGSDDASTKSDLALGKTDNKIEPAVPNWNKAESTLVNKSFQAKKEFAGLGANEAIAVSKGNVAAPVETVSKGSFETAPPNLKEKTFMVARKDAAFKIQQPKDVDQLSNSNLIPVHVGNQTSRSVRSLDSEPLNGGALKNKGTNSESRSSAFSGLPGRGGSSGSGSDGGSIATGAGAGSGPIAAGPSFGSGAGSAGGSASGSTTGNGYGSGSGSGSGSGYGSERGAGRPWGTAGFSGGSSGMASRRTLDLTEAAKGESASSQKGSGYSITGALANRQVHKKQLPSYEMDTRVALRFRVDWSGHVLDGIIVEISSGNPSFDRKVMAALKQWMFSSLSTARSNEIQEGIITFVFRGV